MIRIFNYCCLLILSSIAWANPQTAVTKAQLPANLTLELFLENITNPRSIDVSKDGHVAIGTRRDQIYLLFDVNQDGSDYQAHVITNLNGPNGVVWYGDDLYVADLTKLYKVANVYHTFLANETEQIETLYNDFYNNTHHGTRFLDFNQDGELFIALGVPCNVCIPPENTDQIVKFDLSTKQLSTYAAGIRNSVGFDFHPITGEMWATDNGRDWLGDEMPHDELNHIPSAGMHFGFPFCHDVALIDPEFGEDDSCEKYTPATYRLGPHVAALGIHFLEHDVILPKHTALVALHGSWNRSERIGYSVKSLHFSENGQEVVDYQEFLSGWLESNGKYHARPVDIAELNDGSILITDDGNDAIYRVRTIN